MAIDRRPVKRALRAFGVYRRRLASEPYAGVAVLGYHGVRDNAWPAGTMHFEPHHVTVSTLEAHCRCIRELDCIPLALADWEAIAAGARPLPPRAVMLTFDDGYRSVLTHALPVLERYGIPAAVFVCSGPVARGVRFWFDAVAERHGEEAVERAKTLPHEAWSALADASEMHAGPDDPHAPLTVGELQRLAAHPLMTIGVHTVSHPVLARGSAAVQQGEIAACRAALEAWTDRPVTALAYPNGRPALDYTSETAALAASCGVRVAFSTRPAFAVPGESPLDVPRFLMLDSVEPAELAHRLAMSWPRDRRSA